MAACRYCAGEVPADAARCPHCGHDLAPAPDPAPAGEGARRTLVGSLGCGILLVLLALLSIVLLFGLLAGGLLG